MGIFSTLIDSLKIGDDYEDENYVDDFEEEVEEMRTSRPSRREKKAEKLAPEYDSMENSRNSRRSTKASSKTESYSEQAFSTAKSSPKVVPFRGVKDLEVSIVKPTSFADSRDICDQLLEGKAVIVNLEGFDAVVAQNIINFVSGAIYAVNGNYDKISKYIFVFAPSNVDISGETAKEQISKTFDFAGFDKRKAL